MEANQFTWMIAIPLVFSPIVYLAGRLGRNLILSNRSVLVRILALVGLLAAWFPFVQALQTFLAGGQLGSVEP